jgi:deoxycytidine triphosphate deaminase
MVTKTKSKYAEYPGAVLLADHIKYWVKKGYLIVPDRDTYQDIRDTFEIKQLKRAKYDVRLGKAYYQAGEYHILDDNHPLLEIVPYELVFVESYEVFKIPSNVVAVYDLRIKCCMGGLGLQTGLQLDPEYYGRFFCPLFNFSDTNVTLKYKSQFASVQFIYTTLFNKQSKDLDEESFDKEKNERFTLSQALPDIPRQSGLVKIYKELQSFSKDRNDMQIKIDNMVSSVFNVMAFMIMALAVVVSTVSIAVTRSFPGAEIALAIGASVIILVIGFLIIFQMKRKNNNK